MTTPTETQAMCERLRKVDESACYDAPWSTHHVCQQAAALLTRQQEEIERWRNAFQVVRDEAESFKKGNINAMHLQRCISVQFNLAALQAKPETTACDSEDPTEMCMHCHCWKFTRSTCK